MLTKSEILRLLVAYARMRDQELVEDDQVLSLEVCFPKDRERIRKIMKLLVPLRDSFRYTESPEFLGAVAGKSEAVRQMKMKLASDPVRRKEAQDRFDRTLRDLLLSDEVLSLTPAPAHGTLREIAELVRGLSNPDDNEGQAVH